MKDPQSSELGKRIVSGSIGLLERVGFESFTFKKLGAEIGSTEASIYRYFESKHKLLLYLTAWYWAWMNYRMYFALANVDSPVDRLKRAIRLLSQEVIEDSEVGHINETVLHKVVIAESTKVYFNKEVDEQNSAGVFMAYKELVQRVSDIILEIDKGFKYPHMLVSTVIEGSQHQRYYTEHLPKLTDVIKDVDAISEFYSEMVFKTLGLK